MKKTLAIVLAVALLCMVAVGTTLTYFTDTKGDVNTMTVGNVKIQQNELDRNGNEFVDQKLFPAVIVEFEGTYIPKVDGLWKDTAIKNEIDKIVTVTNKGTEEAYVRTVFAFETCKIYVENTSDVYGYIHDEYLGVNGTMTFLKNGDDFVTFTVNGVEYALAVCTYAAPLAAGNTTTSSLRQFFLSPHAGNEFYDLVGSQYTILTLSQAVQTAGFDSAEEALNAAFGEVNATNAASWFATLPTT